MEEFITQMEEMLPEFPDEKYFGKRLKFPFAHPDTRVDFSRVQLKQELPGEVFEMSYPDCPMQCAEHEEELQSIVRDSCHQVNWAGGGNLLLRFGNILLRKKRFSNNLSAEEIVQTLAERRWDMKVNVRNQYTLNDDGKILEIFERLGAVKKSEEALDDELRIPIGSFEAYLNANTMALSKVIQKPLCRQQKCLPFPKAHAEAENVFAGLIMHPIRHIPFEFDKLCAMCNDPTLLSILKTPGLGFLSKKQDPERFVIDESCVDWISTIFSFRKQLRYSFDLDGVEIVFESAMRVNYGFEDETEGKMHQRTPGPVTSILFPENKDLPVDTLVSVVTRVILALKDAVRDGEMRRAMFEVVHRMNERVISDIFDSPKWCLSPSQRSAREEITRMLNKPPNQERQSTTASKPSHTKKHTRSEPPVLAILKPIRDGQTLEEMLGVSPGVHPIPLRAAVRRLLEKIEELRHWSPTSLLAIGLDANGQDLTRLKQKLLDAAAERNLSL